jgi:molybdopterin/thiamine biosynthesis adenylyltransferase
MPWVSLATTGADQVRPPNGIPLGWSLILPVHTVNSVQTLKVEAAKNTLQFINPDVDIQAHSMDITTVENFDKFQEIIKTGGVDGGQITLVLGCVDNFGARIAINQACGVSC